MNFCADYEERLNDFLDEEISPAARAEVERHLEACAGCREYLAALRSLRERTASLPRSLEPERDLWPGIREGLPSRRRGTFRPLPGFPAWLRGWGALAPAAASVVVVLFIAAALLITLRRGALPPGPGEAAPPAGSQQAGPATTASPEGGPVLAGPAVTSGAGIAPAALPPAGSLAMAGAEYRAATEKLLAALQRERGGVSPEALKVIEENLRIVDSAIQEIYRAAADHPDRKMDESMVTNLYRTRFDLLRQALRLSSREGEEKQS